MNTQPVGQRMRHPSRRMRLATCTRTARREGTAQDIRQSRARWRSERGAVTAEYAIATLAAVGFAGLLVVILRSEAVRGMLLDLVQSALTIGG